MAFRLARLRLTLAYFKDQSQGHTYFDREYLANNDRYGKHYYCPKYMWHVGFRLTYIELTLTYAKGEIGRRNVVPPNILTFLYFDGQKLYTVVLNNDEFARGVKIMHIKNERKYITSEIFKRIING